MQNNAPTFETFPHLMLKMMKTPRRCMFSIIWSKISKLTAILSGICCLWLEHLTNKILVNLYSGKSTIVLLSLTILFKASPILSSYNC